MGFVQGKSNQTADDRNRALSNIVFASDVAEESAWVSTTTLPINGLSLFTQTVYSGSTIIGSYNLLLVKNSHNETGAYYYWDGQAGSTGATITAELRVTFTPSDAAAAPAPTYNTRGRLLATSSALDSNTGTIGALYNNTWTLETNSGLSSSGTYLREPELRHDNAQLGYWFVLMIGNTEINEVFTPFDMTEGTTFNLRYGHSDVRVNQVISGYWSLVRTGANALENTTVKVYLAGIY